MPILHPVVGCVSALYACVIYVCMLYVFVVYVCMLNIRAFGVCAHVMLLYGMLVCSNSFIVIRLCVLLVSSI